MRSSVGAKDLALACLSGVLLILSFPKFDLTSLAWLGLIPLLVALEEKRLTSAFLLSSASGLIFSHGIFYWIFTIGEFNLLDQILLAGYLSFYFGVFGLALAWIRKRNDVPLVVAAPPLWVALEYLRAHASFLSLPWMLLGYSQYLCSSLIQITSLTGVYGLSFLIVLTNALGADMFRYWRHARRSLVLSAATVSVLLISTYVYGRSVLSQPLPDDRIRIAVVQGNVPQQQGLTRQALLDRYATLTRRAAQGAPVLIVWPETAVPGDIKHDRDLQRKIGLLALETEKFLLVGASQYAKFSNSGVDNRDVQDEWYNSVLLLSPQGRIEGEYRKIALIPFGEYEPLRGIIPWPRVIAPSFGKVVPGDSHTLFSIDGRQFGAVICWEVVFPDLFREFVKRGAIFMVNATNESWFGATAVPHQLLAMAVIRAAENRTSIVRAANTALSAFIDPHGRIVDRLRDAAGRELFVEGVLVHDVHVSRAHTLYTRYGDIFAFLQIALSAALLARSWSSLTGRH